MCSSSCFLSGSRTTSYSLTSSLPKLSSTLMIFPKVNRSSPSRILLRKERYPCCILLSIYFSVREILVLLQGKSAKSSKKKREKKLYKVTIPHTYTQLYTQPIFFPFHVQNLHSKFISTRFLFLLAYFVFSFLFSQNDYQNFAGKRLAFLSLTFSAYVVPFI